jgi:Reverse transcriptase (RNA-dependent DNA polymerase)
MRVSQTHASTVPLLLNPESGVISPQFHVVVDDWFTTIAASTSEFPDFRSDEWYKMFGDTEYQYVQVGDEDDDAELDVDLQDDGWLNVTTRKDKVQRAMDRATPPVPLPVADPPLNLPPEEQKMPSVPTQSITPLDPSPAAATNEQDWDMLDNVVDKPTNNLPLDTPQKLPSPGSVHQRESPTAFAPPASPAQRQERMTSQPTATEAEPAVASPRRTRSMTRVTKQALRRSNQTQAPQFRLNLLCEKVDISDAYIDNPADCCFTEHPSLEYGRTNIPSTLRYMTDALLCTTPPALCASTVVSLDAFKASVGDPDTLSYDEAMSDKENVDAWQAAARKEIETLESHGTWEVSMINQAKTRMLPGTWVFKTKRSPNGTVIKRKARYCVRGDLQEGEKETFAPVVGWSTVRLFLVLAMILSWETETIDFSSAFVQALL